MLSRLAIYNYRSLRDFIAPLEALNLVTGPNASGKSNVYRALRLLADIAQGRVIGSLAREGGFESTCGQDQKASRVPCAVASTRCRARSARSR